MTSVSFGFLFYSSDNFINVETIQIIMKLAPTFICENCNFRYRSKSGKTVPPAMCPNCGTEGSMIVQPDANDLIREVSEIF